jgi:enoyl-CoA hydratase/carnithine racemase
MNYSTLLTTLEDFVLTVTLNRPAQANSFNHEMIQDFSRLWDDIREDDSVRVIVLRAAEGRSFCTGVDVKQGWRAPGVDPNPFDYDDPGEWLGPKSNHVWKPFIVAAHGMVAGGAFYWLNESDITICSDDATFFDPHLKLGKLSAVEPIGALGRIPYQEISRMVLMADQERISAATALRISLVTEVTSPEDLWARADEIAKSVASREPVAVQGSIRALWEAQSLPRQQAINNAVKYIQISKAASPLKPTPSNLKSPKWSLR